MKLDHLQVAQRGDPVDLLRPLVHEHADLGHPARQVVGQGRGLVGGEISRAGRIKNEPQRLRAEFQGGTGVLEPGDSANLDGHGHDAASTAA